MGRKRNKMPEPAVRIVDGKRINLKDLRHRRATARAKVKPPIEDTRVSDIWARQDARSASAKRANLERKAIRNLAEGGFDGTQLYAEKIKISTQREKKRDIRCRPGTFEWRYGRDVQDVHFEAGNRFAILWERAGTAAAASPGMEANGHGDWKGLPDGRVAALDRLQPLLIDLGKLPSRRLVLYCVEGKPVSEIARTFETPIRDMSAVLHHDLRALAGHMKLL